MRRCLASFICVLLLAGAVSFAQAQSISCPEANVILTVPDSWTAVPLSASVDPDLRLLLDGGNVTLSVYVADSGGLMPESFQVFVGDEKETGVVSYGGMDMSYVFGVSAEGEYRIYTWLDRRNQVQLYFLVTGAAGAVQAEMDEIMNTLVFK